jgi:hypothetical protein
MICPVDSEACSGSWGSPRKNESCASGCEVNVTLPRPTAATTASAVVPNVALPGSAGASNESVPLLPGGPGVVASGKRDVVAAGGFSRWLRTRALRPTRG